MKKTSFIWIALAIICVFVYRSNSENAQIPQDEANFIKFNLMATDTWNKAPNDIQREGMRSYRDKNLCDYPKKIVNWVGIVSYVGSYWTLDNSDPASLSVKIDDDILLRTEGNLQDLGTKIDRTSPLFNSVANLGKGQRIRFSGEFLPGNKTCFHEISLTDSGSLTDPAYIFKCTEITAIK